MWYKVYDDNNNDSFLGWIWSHNPTLARKRARKIFNRFYISLGIGRKDK